MRDEPYPIGTVLFLWEGFTILSRFMIVEGVDESVGNRYYNGQGWGTHEENLISLKEFEDKLDEFMRGNSNG